MTEGLLVGTGQVDITPPVGTALAGALTPRRSVGVEDPLLAKAIVLESGRQRLAYVILDLIKLYRKEGDAAVKLASERTGIAEVDIVWAASHTHTGPYTGAMFGATEGGIARDWLAGIPDKFARAVEQACDSMQPARMSCLRGFQVGLSCNRRLLFKNGRAINTWNLARADRDVQSIGSAGPIDPEVGILAFERSDGDQIAVLFHFALHTNTNFGRRFSADYPAVVATRIRDRYGPQVCTLFVPGASADINSNARDHVEAGNALADVIIRQLDERVRRQPTPRLAAAKREVTVSFRDLTLDQEERIRASGWPDDAQEVFRRELEIMRKEGRTEARTVLQAWRMGDIGFASLPGELFVEWGLKIKRESPFPWTYPVELGGDYLGYLVTGPAWEAGGYESLIARSARPSAAAVAQMVNEAQDMLRGLYGGGTVQ